MSTYISSLRGLLSNDYIFRLTVDKDILQVQQEGRELLLKSRQKDLEISIEEVSAEIRRKTYDKYKFHGASFINIKTIYYFITNIGLSFVFVSFLK